VNRTLPAALAVAIALAACSGGDDAAPTTASSTSSTSTTSSTTSSTTTTTTTPRTTTTTIPDVPRMPLTGVPIADESEVPDRPALVVKISNAPLSVMPQAGLNQADIVIEEVINDQSTRFAAVFHSEGADPVGPIRSGRAQDINLLLAFDRPLFAWSGGNPAVTRAIEASDLIDLSALRSTGYYRRSGRKNPNDLYSSTDALWAQTTDDAGRPPVVFPYLRPGQALTGRPATSIEITLDGIDAQWEYDAETGRYFRTQEGIEHNTESATGVERVWADNVVVMMANYGVNTFDGNPDAQMLGSNPVYIFSGGTVREGMWLRFEATDPIGLFDNLDDLDPLGLQPGRTWLEVPRNIDGVLTWK
jgi:hypothetical protein